MSLIRIYIVEIVKPTSLKAVSCCRHQPERRRPKSITAALSISGNFFSLLTSSCMITTLVPVLGFSQLLVEMIKRRIAWNGMVADGVHLFHGKCILRVTILLRGPVWPLSARQEPRRDPCLWRLFLMSTLIDSPLR